MNIDIDIIIAVIGGLINMFLATLIPCLIKDTKNPILLDIKKVFETNKSALLTSTAIIIITIYLACKINKNIDLANNLGTFSENDYDMDTPTFDSKGSFFDDNKMIIFKMNPSSPNIKNLARFNY